MSFTFANKFYRNYKLLNLNIIYIVLMVSQWFGNLLLLNAGSQRQPFLLQMFWDNRTYLFCFIQQPEQSKLSPFLTMYPD